MTGDQISGKSVSAKLAWSRFVSIGLAWALAWDCLCICPPANSIKNIKTTRITFYRSLGVYPCIKHVLDVFYWLIIDFLESNNLGEVDPKIVVVDLVEVGITARQPTDKISIFKTFYLPIKHFMSKSTVFVSNLVYFSHKKNQQTARQRYPQN